MSLKLNDAISFELDNIDEHGRTLELGSYSGIEHGLALNNGNNVDCFIDIVEYPNSINKNVYEIKVFDESGLEVIQFDEDELRELIIERIVIV